MQMLKKMQFFAHSSSLVVRRRDPHLSAIKSFMKNVDTSYSEMYARYVDVNMIESMTFQNWNS